jgi:heptosyltransferase-2
MNEYRNILVFHTAFIGDIVLTLPMVQLLKQSIPAAGITFVATPVSAGVLRNHPAIDRVIEYDKRNKDSGVRGIRAMAKLLEDSRFDLAIIPHRSVRSATIPWLARIPRRIGFNTSSGRLLLTDKVQYVNEHHEITRTIALLKPLGITTDAKVLPDLYPSADDETAVNDLLSATRAADPLFSDDRLVAVAPGSLWYTKRWRKERFEELGRLLRANDFSIALIGGADDATLCADTAASIGNGGVVSTAGKLSLLQSAALMKRCKAVVSNDSAPMHLAMAMRTPVIAIFGATVPQFGFAPLGERDVVVETHGLKCRPCSIHGGHACPIKTFECMEAISADQVMSVLRTTIERAAAGARAV